MAITWAEVEERGEPGQCRSCGAQIWWILTATGKRAPYNPSTGVDRPEEPAVSHFATCPQSQAWRRSKAKA